jgi:hypothetical protein
VSKRKKTDSFQCRRVSLGGYAQPVASKCSPIESRHIRELVLLLRVSLPCKVFTGIRSTVFPLFSMPALPCCLPPPHWVIRDRIGLSAPASRLINGAKEGEGVSPSVPKLPFATIVRSGC